MPTRLCNPVFEPWPPAVAAVQLTWQHLMLSCFL